MLKVGSLSGFYVRKRFIDSNLIIGIIIGIVLVINSDDEFR